MPEHLYLDPELKEEATRLFLELGLDLNTAIHLFLRQSLRERGLPFTPRLTPFFSGTLPSGQENSSGNKTDYGVLPSSQAATAPEACLNQDAGSIPSASSAGEVFPENNESSPAADPAPEILPDTFSPSKEPDTAGAVPAEEAKAFDTEIQPSQNDSELRQAFLRAGLIGATLRRVRSLNRLYAIGEPNPHVQGWREVYVSGDEPFALDFGAVRVELGFRDGGALRMMDGRLPDEVLEADAVYPHDLSAIFSSVTGQTLTDVSSSRVWNGNRGTDRLTLRFANGCTLNFAPGGEWGALWLSDPQGAVMFAPEAVWLRVLGDRTWNGLR